MLRKIIFTSVLSLLFFCNGIITAQENTSKLNRIETTEFYNTDVGNPAVAGKSNILKEGFDITAGGADIWGVKDEFHFAYLTKKGDFDIVARIESLSKPHLYTKAGLMARETLTGGSRHVFFQLFPDNSARNKNNGGFEFQYRQLKDGEMKAIYPACFDGTPEFPVTFPNTWIRLKREGNLFTGYTGTDGKTWKEYTSFTLKLPKKIYLGLAVTSHNKSEAAVAKFRDISFIVK